MVNIDTKDAINDMKVDIVPGTQNQPRVYLETKYSKGTNKTFMPQIGLGTWLSPPGIIDLLFIVIYGCICICVGKVEKAVEVALTVGYKHIDTAWVYGNEPEIGTALKKLNIARDKYFITSKLWNTMHNPALVVKSLKMSLKNLGLEYLDLYLIHWPMCFEEGNKEGLDPKLPKNPDGTVRFGKIWDIIDTYKAMEKCVELGLTKHIGLSNFNIKQIQIILDNCTIKPVMNQCESHPYLPQTEMINFLKDNGMYFTGYSPLGSPKRPSSLGQNLPILMEDKSIINIAKDKGVTVANVLCKWQIQRGCIVIPKSVTPSRIKSNINIFGFELTQNEMNIINNINKKARYCYPQINIDGKLVARDKDHPYFPF